MLQLKLYLYIHYLSLPKRRDYYTMGIILYIAKSQIRLNNQEAAKANRCVLLLYVGDQ